MSSVKNALMLLWAFFECLLFSGWIFGWNSLAFVLIDSGIYSDLCPKGNASFGNGTDKEQNFFFASATSYSHVNTSLDRAWRGVNGTLGDAERNPGTLEAAPRGQRFGCTAQEARLAVLFSTALSMFRAGSALMGYVQYKHGTRVARFLAICSFSTGVLLIAFVDQSAPWLIFFGLLLVGLGGMTIFVTNAQLSVLFGKGASTVIGGIMGAMDASSMGFFIVKVAYDNRFPRMYSCLIALGVFLLMTSVSTFGWMPKWFVKAPDCRITAETQGNGDLDDNTRSSMMEKSKEVDSNNLDDNTRSSMMEKSKEVDSNKGRASLHPLTGTMTSVKRCVLSPVFALHVLWLSVLSLCFSFALAALNPLLIQRLQGDRDKVSHFTNTLQYVMMAGFVTSPVAGSFYDSIRKRTANSLSRPRRLLLPAVIPLATTTALGAAMTLSLLTSHPNALYLTFALLVMFRSLLFGLATAFVSIVFPTEFFGFMFGLALIISGLSSLLTYAFIAWANALGFRQVIIFLGLVSCTTLAHPGFLWWRSRASEPRPACS